MYKCQFPHCEYVTTLRSQIHHHHIIPKELSGSNAEHNLIWLCPNHHTSIYIPEAVQGHHTKYNDDSIIIYRWRKSTSGKVLEYRKMCESDVSYYFIEKK